MGHFGAELKFAGYDMVILEGAAESPTMLALLDDKVAFQPAIHLWVRSTREAEVQFKKDLKDDWTARETYLTLIGPAGEKQLSPTGLVSEGFLALGGAGLGAVLGAKNLNGMAVRGQHSVLVADGSRLRQVIATMLNKVSGSPYIAEMMLQWGTGFLVQLCAQKGILPQNNFQSRTWDKVMHLGLEALTDTFAVRSRVCFSCPVACLKQADFRQADRLTRGLGPTYTAIGALGNNLGITDLTAIGRANLVMATQGLDPVATGGFLALDAELLEKGRATPETPGIEFHFGEGEGLPKSIESLVNNQDLPQAWKERGGKLAEAWGADHLFMGVKGAPLAPFDPRGIQGLGLHFATSNLGPHHADAPTFIDELLGVHQRLDPDAVDGKPELVKEYQNRTDVLDSLGFCHRLLLGLKFANLIPMVNSVMGMQFKADELVEVGERVWNLERLFNQRAGFTHQDDRLPERFVKEPLERGPAQGQVSHVPEMLSEYY
jgi:aldehyde:ferredoxin oxidoreductase